MAGSADADGGKLSGTPVERIHISYLRAHALMGPGDESHQVNELASIEGQLLHRAPVHHFAYAGIGSLQKLRSARYSDSFCMLTHLQRGVERHLLADLELDLLTAGIESITGHLDLVRTGRETFRVVETRAVGRRARAQRQLRWT